MLEAGTLFGFTIALFIVTRFAQVPENLSQPLNLIIALLPLALWLVFSWWREQIAPQPRRNLIAVAVVTALAANAVGIPLIVDVFQVDRWLPLESAIDRIIGYTFTAGLAQSVIMYLVIRYIVWVSDFRIRLDAVAYGAASAVGYATVLSLEFVLTGAPEPAVTAMNTFNQLAVLMCTGLIMSYGLAEMSFNEHLFPLLMVATVALATFITGAAIPLISGFANAAISPLNPISTVSPLLGFLFSAGLLAGVGLVFWFLYNTTEDEDENPLADAAGDIEL